MRSNRRIRKPVDRYFVLQPYSCVLCTTIRQAACLEPSTRTSCNAVTPANMAKIGQPLHIHAYRVFILALIHRLGPNSHMHPNLLPRVAQPRPRGFVCIGHVSSSSCQKVGVNRITQPFSFFGRLASLFLCQKYNGGLRGFLATGRLIILTCVPLHFLLSRCRLPCSPVCCGIRHPKGWDRLGPMVSSPCTKYKVG